MADLLTTIQAEIKSRMEELKPAADEYARLEEGRVALGDPAPAAVPRRRPGGGGRAATQANRQAAGTSGRRRSGGGNAQRAERPPGARGRKDGRAAELLAAVTASPGRTVGEYAAEVGMRPTYAYKVIRSLRDDGALRSEGRNVYPADR